MQEKIKRKINQLLALSNNNTNEAEAQAALLKAQELMAKYKIANLDTENQKKSIRSIITDFPVGKSSYRFEIALVVCKNFNCASYITSYRKGYNKRTSNFISIMGLEQDIEICENVLFYCLQYVDYRIKALQKEHRDNKRKKKKNLSISIDYGLGFSVGLDEKFESQINKNEWGLIIGTVPKKVNEKLNLMDQVSINDNLNWNKLSRSKSYQQGFFDGRRFNEKNVIERG